MDLTNDGHPTAEDEQNDSDEDIPGLVPDSEDDDAEEDRVVTGVPVSGAGQMNRVPAQLEGQHHDELNQSPTSCLHRCLKGDAPTRT